MRVSRVLWIAAPIALAGTVAFAQGRGHSGKPPGAAHGPAAPGVAKGPKASHGQPASAAKAGGPEKGAGKRPISEHLAAQPQLRSRLPGRLPAGTNIDQASTGFTSLGQFVATVCVSRNLGIPFDTLKSHVTGPSAVPLGQAIHQLRPDAKAKDEAAHAEAQASQLLGAAEHK
jgi:hypothetical protein